MICGTAPCITLYIELGIQSQSEDSTAHRMQKHNNEVGLLLKHIWEFNFDGVHMAKQLLKLPHLGV